MAYRLEKEKAEDQSDRGSHRRPEDSNEIFVMEDKPEWRASIEEALRSLRLKVRFVYSENEAVDYVRQGVARYFILDIAMGGGRRKQEGLNALERIKSINRGVFVAVYSNFPDLLKKASGLSADFCQEKSADPAEDMQAIVKKMLAKHLEESAPHFRETTNVIFFDNWGRQRRPPEPDRNHALYEQLRSDPEWMAKNAGKYIAIVDGALRGEDADRERLLRKARREFAKEGKRIYFTQVEEQEEVVIIHSPLYVID